MFGRYYKKYKSTNVMALSVNLFSSVKMQKRATFILKGAIQFYLLKFGVSKIY